MKYVYPAVLTPDPAGCYTVAFPDLPGCGTEGDTLADALYMGAGRPSMGQECICVRAKTKGRSIFKA